MDLKYKSMYRRYLEGFLYSMSDIDRPIADLNWSTNEMAWFSFAAGVAGGIPGNEDSFPLCPTDFVDFLLGNDEDGEEEEEDEDSQQSSLQF